MKGSKQMPARILPRLSAKHRSFGDIVRKLHLLLVHRRDRRRLAVLDDHLLRDIGITRQAALREAESKVWDAPDYWIR
jgi:uncharacterized protein YjiS (DUF1127 family)